MLWPFLFVALFFATIGFAIYGFIRWISSNSVNTEVTGTYLTLDSLYVSGQIDSQEFISLRRKLISHYPAVDAPSMSTAARIKWLHSEELKSATKPVAAKSAAAKPAAAKPASAEPASQTFAGPTGATPSGSPPVAPTSPNSLDQVSQSSNPLEIDSSNETGPSSASATYPGALQPAVDAERSRAKTFDEMPAAPSVPRRTWSDLLAGFMQENNIRWGELASGILIVGSAVGLVISLREELRETIPYFPALLFMLITAAINGAGIYTLKRWKLRNTSRGVLVIGLLLVPLNFLAACILRDERRGLDDPIYWLAVVVGIVGFSYITWTASRCLLRWRNLPLFSAVMGSSSSLLLTNRFEMSGSSSVQTWLLGLLPLIAFAGGSITFAPKLWQRTRWNTRTANRLWLCLGIGVFAFLTALSLIAIRSNETLRSIVALTPIWGTASVLVAWFGMLIFQGRIAAASSTPRLIATSICILGLLLTTAANLSSLAIPSVFVATSLLTGMALLLISNNRKSVLALPIAWSCLATGSLAMLYLALGRVDWDTWTTPRQLFELATSARAGLWLMFCGGIVLGIQSLLSIRWPESQFVQASRQWNRASGGAIAVLGCVLAVVASFLHPESQFDNNAATAMLAIICLGLLGAFIRRGEERLSVAAIVSTLAFLTHGLLWNPFLSDRVDQLVGLSCRPTILLITAALAFACTAAIRRLITREHATEWPTVAAVLCTAFGLVGAALLVPHQTGFATVCAVGSLVAMTLVAWSACEAFASSLLVAISGIVASIITAELTLRLGWIDQLLSVRHVALQLVVLGVWNAEWQSLGAYCSSPRWRSWLTRDGGAFAQVTCDVLMLAVLAFCLAGICPQIAAELIADFDTTTVPYAFSAELPAVGLAMGSVALAIFAGLVLKPRVVLVQGTLALWLVAWSFGGFPFEDARAFATVNRWLLPVGGALAALAIGFRNLWLPSWHRLRRKLGGAAAPSWDDSSVQDLINFGLVLVVGTVLAITTVAISRFMVLGGESLGGPIGPSFFGKLRKDVSYGGPIGILVSTFLFYAITERRSWLAVAGSFVYQYVVLVSIVLLFLSPHPKLASEWFLHVMQAVSLGMSGYGLVWYYFRDRIRTQKIGPKLSWTQLDVHSAINCLLVLSLAGLITQRFYFQPQVSADWINEAGGKFGVAAFVAVVALIFTVWRQRLVAYQFSITAGVGLTFVSFLASFVDSGSAAKFLQIPSQPWFAFRIMAIGTTIVSVSLVGLLWNRRRSFDAAQLRGRALTVIPLGLLLLVAFCFCVRGTQLDPGLQWTYLLLLGATTACVVAYGLLTHSAWAAWLAAIANVFLVAQLVDLNPGNLFKFFDSDFYAQWIGAVAIASIWIGYYLLSRKTLVPSIRRAFQKYSNFSILMSSLMCLAIGIVREAELLHWIAATAIGFAGLLSLVGLWNDRAAWRVFAPFTCSMGVALCILNVLKLPSNNDGSLSLLTVACVTAAWGYIFAKRSRFAPWGRQLRMLRLAALERNWHRKLPRLQCLVALIAVFCALAILHNRDARSSRYAAASVPLLLGAGMIPLAFQRRKNDYDRALANKRENKRENERLRKRRGRMWPTANSQDTVLQTSTASSTTEAQGIGSRATVSEPVEIAINSELHAVEALPASAESSPPVRTRLLDLVPGFAVGLLTIGAVFLSWADLPQHLMQIDSMQQTSRTTLALGIVVFLYGWWMPTRLSSSSPWLETTRISTVATCLLAILAFAWLLGTQAESFVPGLGSGLAFQTAITVGVVVVAMISGLIAIAVLPQHDPLSLSITRRQGYVYLAQLVTAMLGLHLFFSMPWLFEFGILKYWPYLAMLLSFGGVGVSHLLDRRKLEVLAQPLFNTGALIPIATAAGFWAVDSRADAALVTLLAGLLYLAIAITNQSLWSGVAAIIFGNLSLWLFYDKFPTLAFWSHPQLWLIPPAVSVLIAGQLQRDRLSAGQLATLRYVSLAVIYMSSTSEIFITGLGQQLMPPMILAVLAVLGIFAGMLFQVRAYLYLGSLFLLLAMITMVAHAQQRLDHVWPWWAFGLILGTAILVMFGLFEKRRTEMQAIVGRLNEWDK